MAKLHTLEYYIDTDPGFGKGVPVSFQPGTNISDLTIPVDISGLAIGDYTLYVRAKDSIGAWSLTNKWGFKVDSVKQRSFSIGKIPANLCAGSQVSVPIKVDVPFGSGNTFTAQLSNNVGNFSNPVNIGTLKGTVSDTIKATIPGNASIGDNYRIRVIASTPADTSDYNNTALKINRAPEQNFTITGNSATCPGIQDYGISNLPQGVTYTWKLSGGGTIDTAGSLATINWVTPGSYLLQVTDSNSCGKGQTASLQITVFKGAPIAIPTITANARLLSASSPSSTDNVSGFQWYKNSSIIANATDQNYNAVDDGQYTVSYTNPCGVGPESAPVIVSTKKNQNIAFDSIPTKTFGDSAFTINATASSGLPVSFIIVSGPALISGDTITLTGSGTVVVEARQAGNAEYDPATAVQRSFTVLANLKAPDLAVQNITSNKTNVAANDVVTVSWKVANVGTAQSTTDWTERIYMQSASGENRTLLSQNVYASDGLIDPGKSIKRSDSITIPDQFNIGNQGVFVVELIPGTTINEATGTDANNNGIQQTPWTIKKLLTLEVSASQITEGSSEEITATINRSGSLSNKLTVKISLKESGRISFPSSVTIPAGQSGISFSISAKNNDSIEGTITDTLRISATGFQAAATILSILDDDKPSLSINLPVSAVEGATVTFKVTTNLAPATPLEVFLTSGDQARFPVQTSVTIPAGKLSADVKVAMAQDGVPEVDLGITIIAGASNHNSASATINVKDDDLPALELLIETDIISESAGAFAAKATLRRTAKSNALAFTANLSANLSNTLILPNEISLAEGENEKTFTIGVVDNNLVDGERVVFITASIFVASCGCNAAPASAGSVFDSITVSDNDGAALQLTVNSLTLPEGSDTAALLRITRNTSADKALAVKLSSSDTGEATIPFTISIPIGKTYVDVPITTINDGVTDGSQQVYFEATAKDFSPGSVWVLVSDLNKPDLQITSASVSKPDIQAMSVFNYQVSVKNTGFATAPGGVVVEGYLSADSIIDNSDTLISRDVVAKSIAEGETVNILNAATAPNVPGKYNLLFWVNPDLSITELLVTNNISKSIDITIKPDYTATASVDLPYFTKADTITISGGASKSNGTPAINQQVEVYVITNGLRRELLATTDGTGKFVTQFIPLANEAGHYTVGASFPGVGDTTRQDAFDILGVSINDGKIPQFKVIINDTLKGSVTVKNLSNKSLTDFSLVPLNLPAGANFTFDTIPVFEGNSTINLSYAVTGSALSPGNNFEVATLQAIANEGVIQAADVFYFSQAPNAYVVADITKIEVSASKSKGERLVEFTLVNKGKGSTGGININLPQVNWISSVTKKILPSMATGDSTVVTLKFSALDEVPFDYPITGTIGVSTQNGNSFAIPFSFEKVSDTSGTVKVTVTNQFTYFSAGEPKVNGAHVQIKNYFSGELYAEGLTDTAGVFTATGIPEGKHRIIVEKDKHLPYNNTITIEPGDTVESVVFINYQAITFSWTVVPTAIQDKYDITLTTQFETNVPMPVVTIEMPKTMPQLSGGETYAFNVTLTNHGLITAKDVAINLPASDPEYQFVTNYIPADLLAQQSIQVPVIMQRRTTPLGAGTFGTPSIAAISKFLRIDASRYSKLANDGLNCHDFVSVIYWYTCNISTGLWERGGTSFTYTDRVCSGGYGTGSILPNIWELYQNAYLTCAICPDPRRWEGDTNWVNPFVFEKKSCVDCINDIAQALVSCTGLGLPTAVKAAYCVFNAWKNGGGIVKYVQCIPGLVPKPIKCGKKLVKVLVTCLNTEFADERKELYKFSSTQIQTNKGQLGDVFNELAKNLQVAVNAFDARESWAKEYFGTLILSDAWDDLSLELEPYIVNLDSIRPAAQASILTAMVGFDIESSDLREFFIRWNTSLNARANGILQPNNQYPAIINWVHVEAYSDSMIEASNYAIAKGYKSVYDMYEQEYASLNKIIDQQKNAVCASVKVQFSQQLTMTREAFEGTLEIFNGHPTDKMDSLSVDIKITDADGVPANGHFEIQTKSLTNLKNVTGTGAISAQEKGSVKYLFIPEISAAPKASQVYSFGGSVRYWDPYAQAMVTLPLASVQLTVNPSPNLMLHYFMQRNILGDDALTNPEIEPSVPAELAVMVENHGYGPAVNMTISSAQPKIVENEKGLAINFNLVGSNFQGKPKSLGVTDINFGTIPALETRIGQWYFTSSLLGKFVSYEAEVVHANSFGNPDLSLVKGIKLHELTKSIRLYGKDEDGINDFLVNDIFDAEDEPDIIYFSQGKRTEKVYPATTGKFSSPVLPPTFINTLSVTASDTGWNYIKLDDPGNKQYDIISVTRSDGQAIPLDNAWLTFVTLPVSRPPIYENKFHFVDSFASREPVTYTIVWKPRNF